jgi:ABC-type glycerol-3-phosphate transport system substrate-binding protein
MDRSSLPISFKQIVMGIFGALFVIAFILFSYVQQASKEENVVSGSVEMWGIYPQETMQSYLTSFNNENKDITLRYVYVPKKEMTNKLLLALAEGNGPDLVMLMDSNLVENERKLFEIPYANFPESQFATTYVNHAEFLLGGEGILGFPLVLDPFVLYYNKDYLASSFIPAPAKNWTEFREHVEKISKRDSDGNLIVTAAPFGEFSNYTYAPEVFSMLTMQAGNPMVERTGYGQYVSVFDKSYTTQRPTASAMEYMASFSNPKMTNYTWDRDQTDAKTAFAFGDLAYFIGYATDYDTITMMNPNLNFGISHVPQLPGSIASTGFGEMVFMSITALSENKAAAFSVAQQFSQDEYMESLASVLGVAPAKRGLLGFTADSYRKQVIYESTIISKGWLNPNYDRVREIFERAFVNYNLGTITSDQAAANITSGVTALFPE